MSPNLPFLLHDVDHHAAMPRPSALTNPNGSADGLRTIAQLHPKVPIGYNGATHIRPQNYPFQ